MHAHEFQGTIMPDQTLRVPEDIAARLLPGRTVRVLILVDEPTEDEEWQRLTTEQFFKGYGDGDGIYDHLPAG